jgi:Raf kinase inhibitor-like YbhB/YbcL family protein
MELSSTAFIQGGDIPRGYSCEGEDIAPPLSWRDIPPGAKTLALIVDDPDAPDPAAPTMTWVHWILFDIPPDAPGLPEGGKPLPGGTREGLNDWNRTRYGGPCPPIGRHRYFFKLYALDTALPGLHLPTKALLEQAMLGHVLDRTELVATYQKQRR